MFDIDKKIKAAVDNAIDGAEQRLIPKLRDALIDVLDGVEVTITVKAKGKGNSDV